ncbi:TIGR04211 family SH3 domain-containing protein, partial [Oleiphilus sp. HI0117]
SFLSKIAASICLLALAISSASAETMYIDDTLLVPLRSGEGVGFRIVHKGLKSGTKLEIIEKLSSGYAHVKTPSGIEGYLPSRYLTAQPIAKVKLAQANQELAKLKANYEETQTQLANLKKKHQSLSKEHTQTTSELNANSKELKNIKSISANALNLDKRNRELRESNEQLRNELELIQTENLRLKDKSDSNMMLIGGGLVTLGVILTLLIPIIKPSKKNDSWA